MTWIGYVRLLAEVPSTSCEVYKLPKRAGYLGPLDPGPLFIPASDRVCALQHS